MQLAKHYIAFWVVEMPDGSACEVECQLTPITSYNTSLVSFWTHLFSSLTLDNKAALRKFTPQQLELAF